MERTAVGTTTIMEASTISASVLVKQVTGRPAGGTSDNAQKNTGPGEPN